MYSLLTALCSSALFLHSTIAVDPVVKLNYTSYRGTALSNGVTEWLGVRYAAAPVGDLRFAAPQPPPKSSNQNEVIEASAYAPICLGTAGGPPSKNTSEDCLFMNIFAPSKAKAGAKLPVYFFIQGGGFNSNANPNLNGSGLVRASEMNIVVVNFNYRVGPYGFLAGSELLESGAGGSVNNGLKDQRLALQWVQDNIASFGGDPGHVTMGGDSAGAQSVNLQVTAYGGRNDNLFHATAAESQSFSGLRTVKESQFMYDNLVLRTNCASSSPNTLACLRNLSATALQKQNYNTPFPGAQQAALYMYGPTLDFDFVTDYTYTAYAKGKYVRVPAIGGDDTNEGTIFTDPTTQNVSQADVFLQAQWPELSLAQLKQFNEFYPSDEYMSFPDNGTKQWQALAQGYGEMRYICPGVNISAVQYKDGVDSWNYRWNVISPGPAELGYGVTHTIEVNAIWGPHNTNGGSPESYYPGHVNFPIVRIVQGYWTSFIRSYNPNTYRASGTPEWKQWGDYQRLMFQTHNTSMETVPAIQKTRCTYWADQGVSFGQ